MSIKDRVFESFDTTFEVIGPFRFRVYGDLLGGEAEEVEAASRSNSHLLFMLKTLARKIAAAEGIADDDAKGFARIENALINTKDPANRALVEKYADEVALLTNQIPNTETSSIALETLFLQSRAQVEVDGDWRPVHDPHAGDEWTQTDTRKLPGYVRKGIAALIDRERKGPEAKDAAAKQGKAKAAA